MKVCSTCKLELPLTDFYKSKSKKDGFYQECKTCNKKRLAKYRRDNKEKIAESSAKYRRDNKEKITSRAAKYYRDNPEKYSDYYKKNREKILEISIKYSQTHKKQISNYKTIYKRLNPEKSYDAVRKCHKKYVSECTDNYLIKIIKRNTNLSPNKIPQDLIELKREQILLKRTCKELGNELKKHQNRN